MIDRRSLLTLCYQLKETLRSAITNGIYKRGQAVPLENDVHSIDLE